MPSGIIMIIDSRGFGRKRQDLPIGDVNLHDLFCSKCGKKWRVMNPLCPYICPDCEGQDPQKNITTAHEREHYKCFWCEPGVFELRGISE